MPDGYTNQKPCWEYLYKVEIELQGIGNFVRAGALLDLTTAGPGFVSISRVGQREFFKIQHEKFPKFFGACGFL
jgi:hypothetical protein